MQEITDRKYMETFSREKIIDNFVEELQKYGYDNISNTQLEQFDKFYELLIEWNKKINLTSITGIEEVYIKHFADSLSLIKVTDLKDSSNLIDVGTGAGFPGIPLKIMYPHLKLTLLDSLQKRINYLDIVCDELGLKDVTTIHGRAEDLAKRQELREKFDVCVSRAVANLSTLSELCLPFVKVGGEFISYKSKGDEEIRQAEYAIEVLGGKLSENISFDINDNFRTLITIKKIRSTENRYPRKAGVPNKTPLTPNRKKI